MSTLNVNNIDKESGSTLTIGGSGTTVTLGSGASSSGFGVAVAGIVGVSTFTSSGTWTKATRESALGVTIKRVIVEVQGGGGTGKKSSSSSQRRGGGGGGYARKILDVSSVTSATITVGGTGGTSLWADGVHTNVQATGGTNGSSGAVGTGGVGSGGDINLSGGYGLVNESGGGSSFYGVTSRFNVSATALGYGTGGGGGDGAGPETGAPGIVIVTEIAG